MLIHTYWDNSDIPKLARQCLMSWKRHIPDAEIVIWNDSLAATLKLIPSSLLEQYLRSPVYRRSDFVRVSAIFTLGGLWMDATIALRSFPAHLCWPDGAFRGYTMPHSDIIENWAFAAPAQNPLVASWLDEMKALLLRGDMEYIEEAKQKQSLSELQQWLPYLASHVAMIVGRSKTVNCKVALVSSKRGPLWHATQFKGTGQSLISDICAGSLSGVAFHASRIYGVLQLAGFFPAPFASALKLRSIDRDMLPPFTLPWSPLRRYFATYN